MLLMKIMHVADLHLDSPFKGMMKQSKAIHKQLIQSPYQAFERCVSIAINQEVDFIVIVGDVYNAEKQTIYAQNFFMNQLTRLDKAGIPVVLNHGNHDYLRSDKKSPIYPDNVYAFLSEDVEQFDLTSKNQETVRFYGFSYLQKWIKERKSQEFPLNPRETDYTIGLLHGALADGQAKDAGNYAPFTVQELVSKQYDYWALGHIHQAGVLNSVPLIQYSGTIQGRHRNELGDKGAYIVELTKNSPAKNEFISLAPILWQSATIECQQDWQANDIVQQIEQVIANYRSEAEASSQSQILTITLSNGQRLTQELQEQIEKGELSFAFETSGVEVDVPFVAVAKLYLTQNMTLDAFQYDENLNQSFHAASQRLIEGNAYDDIMKDLFQHSIIQNWLPEFKDDEELKHSIIESAQQLMIQTIGFDIKEVTHED